MVRRGPRDERHAADLSGAGRVLSQLYPRRENADYGCGEIADTGDVRRHLVEDMQPEKLAESRPDKDAVGQGPDEGTRPVDAVAGS